MNVLIIDMTHGGIPIALEFLNYTNFNVFALDIYNTLSEEKKELLYQKGIKIVEKDFLDNIDIKDDINEISNDDFLLVAPIHCNIKSKIHLTHHEAVNFLLKNKINVPIIEVTGVKGKTNVVWMLKEIFIEDNPLVLSSLGIEVIQNMKSHILKKDVSITPASIIKTWELGKHFNPEICIFETSLGGTGLADAGIITNIAENYFIARGEKKSSLAKEQMFKSKITVCDFDSLSLFYSNMTGKINTFGLNVGSNVYASDIKLSLDKTTFKAKINNLKTIEGDLLTTEFEVETFAPAEHHLNNVLCTICASLTINTPVNQIKKGLKKFKGIKGRTSIKEYKGSTIIEEINPGLNVTAIKKSVDMIRDFKNSTLIFGGKYGITCEEIDEDSTVEFLNQLKDEISVILVDELGKNIKNKIKRKYKYMNDFNNAIEEGIEMNSQIILLIYRSIFSDQSKR